MDRKPSEHLAKNIDYKCSHDRKKRKDEEKREMIRQDEKGKWWGDEARTSNGWPNMTKSDTIRIYGQNINGIQ